MIPQHATTIRSLDMIARDVLDWALAHEVTARLLGDVTALELVRLASGFVTSCPTCGAEPWVNIDCVQCAVLHAVLEMSDCSCQRCYSGHPS